MRVPLIWKLTSLVVLGVVTSLVTTAVYARVKPQRVAPAGVAGVQTPITRVTEGPRVGPPTPRRGLGRGVLSASVMKQFRVETRDDVVHVVAEASLQDKRPGWRNVWSIRLLDPDDRETVRFEKIYEDQIFSVPADRKANPTFDDSVQVPVPPGDYIVEVAVSKVRPGIGLAEFRDPKMARDLVSTRGFRRVTITR